ncbi:MAG: nuclear transport factor 2 family protein [Flavobacteriaceae bacterium]
MTRITVFLIALISISIQAQNEKEEVKLVIDTFFKGFHKGDTILMKSVMADKVYMQTVYKNKEGKDILVTDKPGKLTQAIANRPLDQKWDERLLNYNIQVDGNMANAWTPYEFWLNDEFHHCGVNSFQLFKDGEQWKIIYLIDTRRTYNCDPIDN